MQKEIIEVLQDALLDTLSVEQIELLLEKPKYEHLGDIAFPCFTLAKIKRQAPQIIAHELATTLVHPYIADVQAVGGYVNIFLNQTQFTKQVLEEISTKQDVYGMQQTKQQNIVIDFSSPNIAKPFSMGHLRSTVIGNALANIARKNGYDVVRVNHLGDWGTQFGKLIVAYRLWGSEQTILKAPIQELLKLYVRFHEEAEEDDSLNGEARKAFKALEDGEEQALALWKWFKDASLQEFQLIYKQLGIQFDSMEGEAFYNDKMQPVVEQLREKQLLSFSQGARVVELDNMPPCLITKQDGATLYATRDLAAAFYRHQAYNPAKIFYVVGNEQSLHFKQVFEVIHKMGYNWHENLQHVPFGMMLKDGKKMSTRKGRVVLLKDVLDEAISTANENIKEKNPLLQNVEHVAQQVGIGAVIFNDLKNDRLNDIEFSLDQMLQFEGETGPYVQYTYARICSILQKADYNETTPMIQYLGQHAWQTIVLLADYPKRVQDAFEQAEPSIIAKYILQLARSFNKYYGNTRILANDELKQCRLALCASVATVLKDGLKLLGIQAPARM